MEIREAEKNNLFQLLALYTQLHGNPMPEPSAELEQLWDGILSDKNHHVIVGFEDGALVCSCVLVIVPNLTHGRRPYALVENVITHESHRRKGYATAVLNRARSIAREASCYKIMLLTGSKQESTLNFYEKAGYNRADKTGFIQWL